MNQTRRQFLKTVAATAAGVTAAVVAPSVGKEPVPFKPNPVQQQIFLPGPNDVIIWKNWYADYRPNGMGAAMKRFEILNRQCVCAK
jgi:hypothetical protein